MQLAREEVVGAPPDEEEGTKDQRRQQAAVQPAHAVRSKYLPRAIDRAGVETLRLLHGILDL